ncbi:hypothetical protein MKZ38_009312 [Zalerion maritima]|uniref:Uncharacterized protein n=1 Tax=Zalerion maritima TaxID=339359 RepID=A0AAD5RGL7_9PEZI|nr:hypothetical protein MKZ38_009312 [Zalerion maritima]
MRLPLSTLAALFAVPIGIHAAPTLTKTEIRDLVLSGGHINATEMHAVLSRHQEDDNEASDTIPEPVCNTDKQWADVPQDGKDGWCYEKKDDSKKCQFVTDQFTSGFVMECTYLWLKDNQCNVLANMTNYKYNRLHPAVIKADSLPHEVSFLLYQDRVPWFKYHKEDHGWWDRHWHWGDRSTMPVGRMKYQHWFNCPEKS